MAQSLKRTIILMVSILSMLVSNYALSSPMMLSKSQPLAVKVSEHLHHQNADSKEIVSAASGHKAIDCHSVKQPGADSSSLVIAGTEVNSHCAGETGADSCCTTICSSVSYPIQVTQPMSIAFSLALHHSVIIGSKTTLAQNLLRPPSI